MDLVQLEIFKAAYEHGSISVAAQHIHRVPSNLTTRIKQLELDLGVDLFIREKSRLRLSPAVVGVFRLCPTHSRSGPGGARDGRRGDAAGIVSSGVAGEHGGGAYS